MRRVWLTVVAAIALLIGLVWTLQGLNVLSGSAMSGQSIFAALGGVIVLSAALGTWRLWRPRSA